MALAKTLVHQQVAKTPKTETSHMFATNSWTKPTLTVSTNIPGTIIANSDPHWLSTLSPGRETRLIYSDLLIYLCLIYSIIITTFCTSAH